MELADLGSELGPAPTVHIKKPNKIVRGAMTKAVAIMQSITFQSHSDADGKDTTKQSPFLFLPAELRNKIYRYSLVEDQSGHRIRSFFQPPLTCVNRQIRWETLPIYYGQNRFLLSIPHITANSDPKAWPDFIRMFRAFEAGGRGGRGTGSLQFIRDLKCEIIPTSADGFRLLEVCFRDLEGPPIFSDHAICRNRRKCNVVSSRTGARIWQDWLSACSFVGKHLDVVRVTDGRCVWHLISTVIMVAKVCPGATKEIHFHSDARKLSREIPHRSRGTR